MKLQHVQTVLPMEDIRDLKMKTGQSSIKEALWEAVQYYLEHH